MSGLHTKMFANLYSQLVVYHFLVQFDFKLAIFLWASGLRKEFKLESIEKMIIVVPSC